jgi:hypothetical protein
MRVFSSSKSESIESREHTNLLGEIFMNYKIAKMILPAMVAVSSLGIGAAVVAGPAGASTTTTVVKKAPVTKKAPVIKTATAAKGTPVTITGTVTKTLAAKDTFWLKVGVKTYRAAYSSSTKFTKGTASALVKGLSVSVTGTYVGKSVSLIKASSIAA